MSKRICLGAGILFGCIGFAWACAFDSTLREYLDVHFWLPFSKHSWQFEKKDVPRLDVPYAGMTNSRDATPLAKLRAAYRQISEPALDTFDATTQKQALAAARSDCSLSARDREEVELIAAKIDMRFGEADRSGDPGTPELLLLAKKRFEDFLRTAQTPEFLSETRGWLAHIYFRLGDQTSAGKIYLDELNKNGSNLSSETLLNSLQMTYGYDGGPELTAHLDEYFDTAEHAAFAIELVTNPHWGGFEFTYEPGGNSAPNAAETYQRIKQLLEKHESLLRSEVGANSLALLAMRTALRFGDPATAAKTAEMVPSASRVRTEPDFNWMLASARFLSRDYA